MNLSKLYKPIVSKIGEDIKMDGHANNRVMKKLFRPKQYFRPRTITEAATLLAKFGNLARPIAGGTDLLVSRPSDVKYIIDITRLPMDYIKKGEDGLRIGALTTFRNVETSEILKKEGYGILAEAACKMGSMPIRNVATVGGNICRALPSSELCPALAALDAKVKMVGFTGERTVPLEKLFVDVGKSVLKMGELLTEICLPTTPPHSGTAFLKIGRVAEDLSIVNAATRVTLDKEGGCKDVRIIVGGGIGPILIRAKRAEALFKAKKIGHSIIERAAQLASKDCCPRATSIRGSAFYKMQLSEVLVKRVLKHALQRAKENVQLERYINKN